MDYATLWAALVGAGSALGTKAAEGFVSRFFDRRAKLDQIRDDDLQVIERITFEIRDLATKYWLAHHDKTEESTSTSAIVGRVTFLSGLIDELFVSKMQLLREMQVALNRFDSACTSSDFGSNTRTLDPGRCREIEIAAYSLVHLARKQRRQL
jgi:hypothetical protein